MAKASAPKRATYYLTADSVLAEGDPRLARAAVLACCVDGESAGGWVRMPGGATREPGGGAHAGGPATLAGLGG